MTGEPLRLLCTHNKVYQERALNVKNMFLRRGFDIIELRECVPFPERWEVWGTGNSWSIQILKQEALEAPKDPKTPKQPESDRLKFLKEQHNKIKNPDEDYMF